VQLELFPADLKPEYRTLDLISVEFAHFNSSAQAAIIAIGRAYYNAISQTGKQILPPETAEQKVCKRCEALRKVVAVNAPDNPTLVAICNLLVAPTENLPDLVIDFTDRNVGLFNPEIDDPGVKWRPKTPAELVLTSAKKLPDADKLELIQLLRQSMQRKRDEPDFPLEDPEP